MVGKIRRLRHKLHAAAVKFVPQDAGVGGAGGGGGSAAAALVVLEKKKKNLKLKKVPGPSGAEGDRRAEQQPQEEEEGQSQSAAAGAAQAAAQQPPPSRRRFPPNGSSTPPQQGVPVLPSAVFSGTAIRPEQLVQSLSVASAESAAPEERKQQPKKLKMKERREWLLQRLSDLRLARERERARARRRATPVVGDMQVLADALPELSELISSSRTPIRKKDRPPVQKKPEPTDLRLMKAGQKRKLLETESCRFRETLQDPAFRANPLGAIGEHLRKRLREEERQDPR
ncbi:ribosome biogenesis protein SLX9 homolog [Scleropages formosus]|uniref:Ribosome biogenesis protein NOP53 n=1 Tax=Scleropages formosus TaxID=113540 RepID=A0A8C9TIF5_SCLFO|nr:protein FAM207A [Scleropages formosus]